MRRLSEVVDFEVLLARDAKIAAQDGDAALVIRDRHLAHQLPQASPQRRLRAWVLLRRKSELDLPGERAHGIVVLVGWVLTIAGIAIGVSTGAALLSYDGKSPVNVLAWLLYTAALPLVLGLVLVAGLAAPKRWLPRAGAAQALLGAVIVPLLRRLPGGQQWVRDLFGRTGRGTGTLERWMLVGLTQLFTLGLLAAALGTLLIRVSISDLTFSWSTTLDFSDADVARGFRALSLPWADFWPQAVPDETMVAESNYRRFVERFRDTSQREAVDVAVGGTWWRLCAASTVTYGILLRLLLLAVSFFGWRRSLSRWPAPNRPEVRALLSRFEESEGTFAVRRPFPATPPENKADSPPLELVEAPIPDKAESTRTLAVAWGEAAQDPDGAARALPTKPETVLSAGTGLDLSAEQAILETAAERGGSVVVLVPLNEPPIEDVLSFLRELRAVTSEVDVLCLERTETEWRAAPIDPVWRKALARVRGVEAVEA